MSWNGNPLTETKESGKIARRRPPRFELIAGNVCLDFVNTLDDRNTQPKELLESYLDLARFAEDTGLLDSSQVDRLFARSEADPERAREVLKWARELREAIHDVFWAICSRKIQACWIRARWTGFSRAARPIRSARGKC